MIEHVDRMMLCWIAGAALGAGCGIDEVNDVRSSEPASMEQASTSTSCDQEEDCSGGLSCIAGACQPCSEHSQCQSDVCDVGSATSMGPGACIPESSVVYVNRSGPDCGTGPSGGDGTRAHPVCEIRDAISHVAGLRYAIRVSSGRYQPFAASSRTFYVFGPGDGSAVVGEEDLSAGARITNGSRVGIDGLTFDTGVLNGLVCDGSSLNVRHSDVRGDSTGIRATSCTLDLDRVRATSAGQSGLLIDGSGTYHIANSYFAGGDRPAVVFNGTASGIFWFNTVTGGGEIRPGGIDCGTSPREIIDSIVVRATPAAGGAQTVGACVHQRVVVGSSDTRPDPGLIEIDPDLDDQGRLVDTPADRACCIDRGARFVSSLYRDFFGTPRPQGASNDIGAHELVQASLGQ
jgi:hypothetical protein